MRSCTESAAASASASGQASAPAVVGALAASSVGAAAAAPEAPPGGVLDPDELRAVFKLCDPHNTGVVSLHTLLRLGQEYCGGDDHSAQDVALVLRQLDPRGRGVIGFGEFCRGVSAIVGGRDQTMMAPVFHSEPLLLPSAVPSAAASAAATSSSPPPPPLPLHHPEEEAASGAAPTFVLQDCDADSAIGDSASPDLQAKSQCSSMSDGEQFECYGENVELELDSESPPRGAVNGGHGHESPSSAGLTRHTWLRTSLRRSAPSQHESLPNRRWGSFRHSGKRLGSNALASQLYRSSSFNSSGRSSTCDTADDMCSDVSLEEDVLDLSHKVQLLQQQVSVLADNQSSTDDRYTRAKQDSAALQARVHMLEEQLREAEVRADERLSDEQRRHRELMARVDREKELHVENYTIRLQTLELEASSLREETSRLRAQMERLRGEKAALEERLSEADATAAALRSEAGALRDAERRARDDAARGVAANAQLVEELSRELEVLRKDRGVMTPTDSQHSTHLAELEGELSRLRHENKNLQETNEDLQAQLLTRGVEEGRNLLGSGNSIAAELEAMTGEELPGSTLGHMSYEKMRTALKEQQEVNTQLRSYIDGMLLNIVENYPQLLEVKTNY